MTCAWCGRTEDDAAKALSWTTSVENGRTLHYCDQCSRQNLRSIEGKLDTEFW